MMELTEGAAQSLLEGGIDATAALDQALARALVHMPDEHHAELRQAFGRVMAGVLQATVDVAVEAYPQLEPDREAWLRIVREGAARRVG